MNILKITACALHCLCWGTYYPWWKWHYQHGSQDKQWHRERLLQRTHGAKCVNLKLEYVLPSYQNTEVILATKCRQSWLTHATKVSQPSLSRAGMQKYFSTIYNSKFYRNQLYIRRVMHVPVIQNDSAKIIFSFILHKNKSKRASAVKISEETQ